LLNYTQSGREGKRGRRGRRRRPIEEKQQKMKRFLLRKVSIDAERKFSEKNVFCSVAE